MFVLKKTLRAVQEQLASKDWALRMQSHRANRLAEKLRDEKDLGMGKSRRIKNLEEALAASQAALVRANVEQDSRVAAAQYGIRITAEQALAALEGHNLCVTKTGRLSSTQGSGANVPKSGRMPYISDQAWAEAAEMSAKYRDEALLRAAEASLNISIARPAGWMAGAGSV